MPKKILMLLATIPLILFLSVSNGFTKGPGMANNQKKQSKPFLITHGLPHLTMQVKKLWDNPQFNLTEEQKNKLLKIRQATMGGAGKLGGEIAGLEQQVIQGIFSGTAPEQLKPLVDKIAALKAKATMIHLQCIHDTLAILNADQLALLQTAGS